MAYKEKKRWLLFGLPFTFTNYTIDDDMITVNSGLLKQQENDCYMYKIVDVRLETSLMERLFGLGTVCCFGSDVTDKILKLEHIKNAKEIKNYILKQSEVERQKRRTMNTQRLDNDMDIDELDD